MTDRELLELAAKAAGLNFKMVDDHMGVHLIDSGGQFFRYWHPLYDDGDALRLAVKCCFYVFTNGENHVSATCVIPPYENVSVSQYVENGDRYAATRRAIVHAAAEIGKAMP